MAFSKRCLFLQLFSVTVATAFRDAVSCSIDNLTPFSFSLAAREVSDGFWVATPSPTIPAQSEGHFKLASSDLDIMDAPVSGIIVYKIDGDRFEKMGNVTIAFEMGSAPAVLTSAGSKGVTTDPAMSSPLLSKQAKEGLQHSGDTNPTVVDPKNPNHCSLTVPEGIIGTCSISRENVTSLKVSIREKHHVEQEATAVRQIHLQLDGHVVSKLSHKLVLKSRSITNGAWKLKPALRFSAYKPPATASGPGGTDAVEREWRQRTAPIAQPTVSSADTSALALKDDLGSPFAAESTMQDLFDSTWRGSIVYTMLPDNDKDRAEDITLGWSIGWNDHDNKGCVIHAPPTVLASCELSKPGQDHEAAGAGSSSVAKKSGAIQLPAVPTAPSDPDVTDESADPKSSGDGSAAGDGSSSKPHGALSAIIFGSGSAGSGSSHDGSHIEIKSKIDLAESAKVAGNLNANSTLVLKASVPESLGSLVSSSNNGEAIVVLKIVLTDKKKPHAFIPPL